MSEIKNTNQLRQKTYGIFIKPYIAFSGENHVARGTVYVPALSTGGGSNNYTTALGGDSWMLYKEATSFVVAREIVKAVMDELGMSKNDIRVTEIIPIDHIVTPLS